MLLRAPVRTSQAEWCLRAVSYIACRHIRLSTVRDWIRVLRFLVIVVIVIVVIVIGVIVIVVIGVRIHIGRLNRFSYVLDSSYIRRVYNLYIGGLDFAVLSVRG